MVDLTQKRFILPLIVGSGLFMEGLDSTIIINALPTIAKSFAVSPILLNLAVTAYMLSLTILLPFSGWCAERYGPKNIFRIAMLIFAIGSLFCGISTTIWQLIAARIIQGLGAALMVPVGRILLFKIIPKSELMLVMAYLTTPALLGPIIGLPLGGFITTFWSWHWIFFINIPIGILGIFLATRYFPKLPLNLSIRLDIRGWLILSTCLACFVACFESIGKEMIPIWVDITLFLVSSITAVAYFYHAIAKADPIIDLRLFSFVSLRYSILGGNLFRIANGAIPILLSLLLQIVFHFNPFHTGLLMCVSAMGALFMKPIATFIMRYFSLRSIMIFSVIGSGLSFIAFSYITPQLSLNLLLVIFTTSGLFRSLCFSTSAIGTISDIPPERMTQAASLSSIMQQLSLTCGVGVASMLLSIEMNINNTDILALDDFFYIFWVVGFIALSAIFFFIKLDNKTGDFVRKKRNNEASQNIGL